MFVSWHVSRKRKRQTGSQVSEAVDTLKDTKSFINMWPACVVSDIGSESVFGFLASLSVDS